jgi:hypothetical protein
MFQKFRSSKELQEIHLQGFKNQSAQYQPLDTFLGMLYQCINYENKLFNEHLYAELFRFLALTGFDYYFELQIQRISNYPHLKTSKVVSSEVGINRCLNS